MRLIRQDTIDGFDAQMAELKDELEEAVMQLDEHYAELKSAARDRLGSLYDSRDYPDSLHGLFQVSWIFRLSSLPPICRNCGPTCTSRNASGSPPGSMRRYGSPSRLSWKSCSSLVAHLTERLAGQADGKPKVFRDSAVNNLAEFFDRFKQLNVRSNEDLDALVDQCQGIVRGVQPQALRDNQLLRQQVATELGQVESLLDALLVDRPRRNILRRAK